MFTQFSNFRKFLSSNGVKTHKGNPVEFYLDKFACSNERITLCFLTMSEEVLEHRLRAFCSKHNFAFLSKNESWWPTVVIEKSTSPKSFDYFYSRLNEVSVH